MSDVKWTEVPVNAGVTWTEVPHDAHPSVGTSALRQGLQGATGGFSDELVGGGEALGRALGIQGAGGPMKDMGLAPNGPTLDWETLRDAYRGARDRERGALQSDQKTNPMTSTVANLAGSVASPINKLASGMSLAKGGAALGGLSGFARSDADDASGLAKDTALGAGIGFGAGGLLDKLKGIGSGLQNQVDEIATAPLGQDSPRSMAASALDMTHRAGVQGNKMLDNTIAAITPKTGNATADAMVSGVSKLGRYGVMGKAQGVLDGLQYGPKIAQAAALKASPLMEKMGPYAQGLAERSPQVFQQVAKRFEGDSPPKPYDKDHIMQKAQGTKYASVLQSAASRGDQALGATNFILQSTDPDYRKALMLDSDNEDEQ